MASKSQIRIAKCSDEDIPEFFAITSHAFGHDAPFFDTYFPAHDTPAGAEMGTERFRAWKQGDPHATFLKATTGNKIIGCAVWTLMTEAPSTDLAEHEDVQSIWPDEDEREYMKQLWASYVVPRGMAIEAAGIKGVYVLELLAVQKNSHRRGVGTALVRWGTDVADELGIDSIVESSPVGVKCYSNAGFCTEIEAMPFPVDERFSTRRKPRVIFMRRKHDG